MKKIIKHLRKNWLKYGLETLVVIVGVLIAFALNGWTENLKSRKFEGKLKLELYNSIRSDLPIVERAVRENQKVVQSCQIILDAFEDDKKYHDSLRFHFAKANIWWNLDLKTSAYETAKTYGLHFLNNDSSRILLADLYERHLHYVQKLEQRQQDYFNINVIPVLTEHFDIISFQQSFDESIPYDYESLKNDRRYRTILKTTIQRRETFIYFMNVVLDSLRKAEGRIGHEMDG
jgi:hypothetical protein